MELEVRDDVVDCVRNWVAKTPLKLGDILHRIGLSSSKYYTWLNRYGCGNQHNASLPREHWLLPEERAALIKGYWEHPQLGYRRLTYHLLDQGVVAVSPSTTYNVLRKAGLMKPRAGSPSQKGKGFQQPLEPHEHWHIDVSYLNVCGTFYYLCTILDGYSRAVLHWEIREQMTEADIEVVLERAHSLFPAAKPRIISDNGPQFISKDFKAYVRLKGMTHVRTAPYYPQSNGKIERYHKTLKSECIRPKTPISVEDAVRLVTQFVDAYNLVRLHSGIGYITPADALAGRAAAIFAERERKLDQARQRRCQAQRSKVA